MRDHVLRAADWPSVLAHQRLAVAKERDVDVAWAADDPTPGWRFAYTAPTDMLVPRYLADFSRFHLGQYAGSRAIFAQTEDAILTYTTRGTAIADWDVDLKMAIVYALAAHITMPLLAKIGRTQWAEQKANELILMARVNAANLDENTYDTVPDWIAARGYSGSVVPSRYFHPYSPLINVTEGIGVS